MSGMILVLCTALMALAAQPDRGAANGAVPGKRGVAARGANPRPSPKLSPPMAGSLRGAVVQKDPATGVVRRVRGRIDVPGARTPRAVADGFVQTHREMLALPRTRGQGPPVPSEVRSLTATHFTYPQIYNGLPVFGGQVSVHVSKDLKVTAVNNDTLPITPSRGPLTAPQDSASAIQAATAAVKSPGGPPRPPLATAGILVRDRAPVTVWKVTFGTTDPPADWEVMVDARTNAVLSVRNVARYATGHGMVFSPNPVQSSGDVGLEQTEESAARVDGQLILRPLRELDDSGYLQGSYASTAATAQEKRAHESNREFHYRSGDPRLAEVMAYYWITENQLYIQELGFKNILNRAIGMNVNGTRDDQSWYAPSTRELTFGRGGVPDAQDADIILHEYGHAIQDAQVPRFGESDECGAMGEGFGDYWAASMGASIGGPQSPGWDSYVGEWDAISYKRERPAYLRRTVSTKHYPEDLAGEVHKDGEIWSACLWQIRGIVGRQRADRIILESHFSLSPTATFADGANAILDANQALYPGQDQAGIREVFVRRGILQPEKKSPPAKRARSLQPPTRRGRR